MKCLKIFLLLSAFLLLLSLPVYSQDEQADITIAELTTILNENESLQNDYTELMQTYQDSLTAHKQALMELQQKIKLLEIESELREKSLQTLKSETVLTKLGIFGAGFSLGVGITAITLQFSQ